MSILSGFRKQKRYATDEKGRHQLISTWTHTDTVYDDEGKSLTEIIEELPAADVKVSQTATDTGSNYEVLFSESADNVTKDEGARKSSDLKYSPGDKKLIISGSNNGTTDLTGGSVNISRNDNLIKPQLSIYNEHDGSEALLKSDSIQIRDDYTSPTKVLEIQQDDIVLVGDTWDSSNTSLKTALANAGSKVLYGTSAPTSAQGEDGQLYVQLQITEPYLDNFVVDYSDEDDIDTELDIENFQECNVNIKQYRMVSDVETLIYEFDEVLDFSYDLGEQYYVKDDEEIFICKLTRDNRHSSPQNLLIAKQNAEDKLIMTITDAEITSDAIKNIYIKNDGEWLAEEQGVPSPTASDINKVLKATGVNTYGWEDAPDPLPIVTTSDEGKILQVNSSGEWDKGNAPRTNAVQVPPVIFDNGNIKKMTIDGFPGIERVVLTQSAYNALSDAQKQDLSKIYYISSYEFHASNDGKVVIRFNQAGTEKLIFFNGFVDTWTGSSSDPSYYNFPEELRTLVDNNTTWISAQTVMSGNYTVDGTPRTGNETYFGFKTKQFWHVCSTQTESSGSGVKNKANYAILDMLDNTKFQDNGWSDPYDVPGGYDAIYYGNKQYTDFDIPDPLPSVTSADEGKTLIVNSEGEWDKGDIREVPAIHLGDNDKILTVESGEATWASAKKVTHLYDEIPISDPLYLLGTISPSTSPLTIDMTQITANYEELRSTDFAFVFIAEASNAISIPKQYNPVDNDFGIFAYTPSTGQLTVTMSGGYTTGTLVGVVYKKAIIQLNENAKITGQSGTIDCTDVPNADTLTVSDFGIVITHVTYPRTSNTGVDTVAPSISYNQTTKQLSWSVNAVSWDLLNVTGYVVVGNYGDPEYRLITNFVGATGSSDGYRGYVPSPTSSDKDKFLKGDGTWNPVYRELTQAEYDALPSSKNSDGIIYFITDNS